MKRRLGAVSATMLDHAERAAIERMRQEQIRIERQWCAPRRKSATCRNNGKHSLCFSLNCPCKCHMEKA